MNTKTKGVISVIAVLALSLSFVVAFDDNEAVASGDSQTITITSVSYEANNVGWAFHVTVGGNFASPSNGMITVSSSTESIIYVIVSLTSGGTYVVGDTSAGPLSGGSYAVRVALVSYPEVYADATYVVLGGISLIDTSVDAGSTVTIQKVFDPIDSTNTSLTWSSSNSSIATVNGSGVVTGVSEGTVVITATSDENETIYGTCDVTVNAVQSYTITATAGTGGSISPSGSVSVAEGGSQTFTIIASSGYAVSSVMVDGVNRGAISSYTFSDVTANHTISATFAAVTQYVITATAGTGGSISPSGSVSVAGGGSLTFTVTPSSEYSILDIKVDGVSQGAISSYAFSNVTANHTISATFTTGAHYTITATAGTGGSISPSGPVSVAEGGSQTFTVTTSSGYSISDVKVDGVSHGTGASYTFSDVTANHTISVSFKESGGGSDDSTIIIVIAAIIVIAVIVAILMYWRTR